jgi:hypothetical protein
VSCSLSSAVNRTNRNASPFLLCASPVSPSFPLPRALLSPSSRPLSSSSCPPGAPQHRDVVACLGWPELHREDRQQRCSCRSSAAGARRPRLSSSKPQNEIVVSPLSLPTTSPVHTGLRLAEFWSSTPAMAPGSHIASASIIPGSNLLYRDLFVILRKYFEGLSVK